MEVQSSSDTTILVVDDDLENLKLLLDFLGRTGYKILISQSGKRALRQAALVRPDLILLDVMMPDMDGFETCRQLKENVLTRHIPVIFTTALTDVKSKVKGFEVGGEDYVTKPFHIAEVLARVKMHISRRQLEQTLRLEIFERRRVEAELRKLATTDPLTGIYNRRHFFHLAEREFERRQRYKESISIIMLDLDYFKQINDTYGHTAGDKVLNTAVQHFQDSLRKVDVLARYGGEEFVILLPETGCEHAKQMAERLRTRLANAPIRIDGKELKITASFGIASASKEDNTVNLDILLNRADKALYKAKDSGRNAIYMWQKQEGDE